MESVTTTYRLRTMAHMYRNLYCNRQSQHCTVCRFSAMSPDVMMFLTAFSLWIAPHSTKYLPLSYTSPGRVFQIDSFWAACVYTKEDKDREMNTLCTVRFMITRDQRQT